MKPNSIEKLKQAENFMNAAAGLLDSVVSVEWESLAEGDYKTEDNGQRRADSGQWPYRRLQLRCRPHLRLIPPGFPLSHNPTRGEL